MGYIVKALEIGGFAAFLPADTIEAALEIINNRMRGIEERGWKPETWEVFKLTPVPIEIVTTQVQPPPVSMKVYKLAVCAGCHGRLGWEDAENGEWVTCLNCEEGRQVAERNRRRRAELDSHHSTQHS